jgi:hypothetical protein
MNIGFAGCSFTYGSELEIPEETRWSKIVCQQLKANEFNFGKAGSSNDEICKRVFEQTNNTKFDFFVVQVTSNIRFSLVLHKKIISISPKQKHSNGLYDLISKISFSEYNEFDDGIWHELVRWKLVCLHYHLKSLNVKHMFVFMSDAERVRMRNDQLVPSSFKLLCSNISLFEYSIHSGFPLGPNKHPLELGHQYIAKDIILPKMKELL